MKNKTKIIISIVIVAALAIAGFSLLKSDDAIIIEA